MKIKIYSIIYFIQILLVAAWLIIAVLFGKGVLAYVLYGNFILTLILNLILIYSNKADTTKSNNNEINKKQLLEYVGSFICCNIPIVNLWGIIQIFIGIYEGISSKVDTNDYISYKK